jgi:transcriptional regulator with XRE-family HTH domain
MIEITEVRLANFKKIAGTYKTQREFADALNESAGYVNQLLHGKRGIGEKVARKIEESLRMPRGALDVEQVSTEAIEFQSPAVAPIEVTSEELGVINLLRDLTSTQRKKLMDYAKEFKSENRVAFSELGHRYSNNTHAHV